MDMRPLSNISLRRVRTSPLDLSGGTAFTWQPTSDGTLPVPSLRFDQPRDIRLQGPSLLLQALRQTRTPLFQDMIAGRDASFLQVLKALSKKLVEKTHYTYLLLDLPSGLGATSFLEFTQAIIYVGEGTGPRPTFTSKR